MKLLKQANGSITRSDEEREQMIEDAAKAYAKFLEALGFDHTADENSADTPRRVAKAWVNDLIVGTNTAPPKITTFPANGYIGIVMEDEVEVVSMCSHHNLAFTGTAYVAYIPGDRVVGLSKLNRVVEWFSRRPQIQEGLTQQIHEYLDKLLEGNKGIMVLVRAKHTCCSHRGVKHKSGMNTPLASGYFLQNKDGCKDEFYQLIK